MLFGFIVLIVALIFSVAAYYGGFKKIDLSIDVQGGELLIFKSKTGDYKNSGKVMDEIYESLIKDFDITSYKGFGTYYDNPREVKRELLRYDAGFAKITAQGHAVTTCMGCCNEFFGSCTFTTAFKARVKGIG